jgi:hypothetical protein
MIAPFDYGIYKANLLKEFYPAPFVIDRPYLRETAYFYYSL